jgi:hypothetical protein
VKPKSHDGSVTVYFEMKHGAISNRIGMRVNTTHPGCSSTLQAL